MFGCVPCVLRGASLDVCVFYWFKSEMYLQVLLVQLYTFTGRVQTFYCLELQENSCMLPMGVYVLNFSDLYVAFYQV